MNECIRLHGSDLHVFVFNIFPISSLLLLMLMLSQNNVLHYNVIVECIRNLVELINLFQFLRATEVTVDVSIQVKNYITSVAGVANTIELSKGLARFPWEVLAEEIVTKVAIVPLY